MPIIDVLLSVLLVSGSALCIYLIISLKRIDKSIDSIRGDIHNLVDETIPVMKNLNEITEHITTVSSTTERQVLELNDRIEEIKGKVINFSKGFSKGGSDNQVVSMIHSIRAIIKGISAFLQNLNK